MPKIASILLASQAGIALFEALFTQPENGMVSPSEDEYDSITDNIYLPSKSLSASILIFVIIAVWESKVFCGPRGHGEDCQLHEREIQ